MKKKSNDEIDLTNLFLSLWDNKFRILIITTVLITLGLLYFYFLDKKFLASTNIKPISTFENQKYEIFNDYVNEANNLVNTKDSLKETQDIKKNYISEINNKIITEINSKILFSLFIDKIQTREIVEEGIIKSELINKDSFQNEKDYEEAIKKKAILIIDGMTPSLIEKKNKLENTSYWKYNFLISDKKSWRYFLEYIEKQANEEVRVFLIDQFNKQSKFLDNRLKYILEDIEQKILNELDDYKISILNKLAFLEEQADLARTLNIAKNTLEIKRFSPDTPGPIFFSNIISSEDAYYLKGYEMIEKEIDLIRDRKNNKSFIPNLFQLEKIKRDILQDKKIERFKFFFSKTPVISKDDFIAAKINYEATLYKSQQSLPIILGISFLIGIIISFIYLIFNNVISQRK